MLASGKSNSGAAVVKSRTAVAYTIMQTCTPPRRLDYDGLSVWPMEVFPKFGVSRLSTQPSRQFSE